MKINRHSSSVHCIKKLPENFHENNLLRFSPLLITQESKKWRLLEKWNESFFIEKYGDKKIQTRKSLPYEMTRKNGGVYGSSTIKNYFEYCNFQKEKYPYYLDNWQFALDFPELLEDYSIPKAFESWHRMFSKEIKEELRWIFVGAENSGSPMHVDVHMTSAWNVIISGKKMWKFFRPKYKQNVYEGSVDAFNPDYIKYPLFKDIESLVIEQNPGDIVYTPPGWWHQVRNLEKGISLTENFVNMSNWKVVYKFHEMKSFVCPNSKLWAESILNSYQASKVEVDNENMLIDKR